MGKAGTPGTLYWKNVLTLLIKGGFLRRLRRRGRFLFRHMRFADNQEVAMGPETAQPD